MGSFSGGTQGSKGRQWNPYAIDQYKQAQASLPQSYSPLSTGMIQNYMNPYTDSVVKANTAYANQNQDIALNQVRDEATRAGAFGGSGMARAEALTRGQFDLNNQMMTSGLLNQGYGQALQTAQGENSAANQYPLAVQALLGQLAGQTEQQTKGTQTGYGAKLTASFDPSNMKWFFGGA